MHTFLAHDALEYVTGNHVGTLTKETDILVNKNICMYISLLVCVFKSRKKGIERFRLFTLHRIGIASGKRTDEIMKLLLH